MGLAEVEDQAIEGVNESSSPDDDVQAMRDLYKCFYAICRKVLPKGKMRRNRLQSQTAKQKYGMHDMAIERKP